MSVCNCPKVKRCRVDLACLWDSTCDEFSVTSSRECSTHPIVCDKCKVAVETHAVLERDGVFTCRECCTFVYCNTCGRGYVSGYDHLNGDSCKYCVDDTTPVYANMSDFAANYNASLGYFKLLPGYVNSDF